MKDLYLSILIPCLNEEETIEQTVRKAKTFLDENNILGEVLVVDNDSSDNSETLAIKAGARVVKEKNRGYGNALKCGNLNAKGKYIIMGDADGSYDFSNLNPFIEKLESGADLVIGNRFATKMEKNAMSFSHKYIGNPFLSFIGRKMFDIEVKDFHCGLRGYRKDKILKLDLQTNGMDYASEMIIRAKLEKYTIKEVPITLYKDGRINTRSHLNSFKDGMLHLKTMFRLYKKDKIMKKEM